MVFDFRLGRGRDGPKRVPGAVRRNSADRRLYRLRPGGRAEDGACRLLGACPKEVLRGGEAQPRRYDRHGIVARIDELFGVDAEARAQDLTTPPAMRCARSKPGRCWICSSRRSRRRGAARLAFQRAGQGGLLHARAVAETDALPGVPGAGAEQQPGGELDAPGRSGTKELDPRGQPAGRAEGGGHSVRRRELPPHEDSGPRLPGRRPARPGRHLHPAARRTHPRGLGRPEPVARIAAPVGVRACGTLTLTVDPAQVRARLGLKKSALDVLVGGPPCQGFSINASIKCEYGEAVVQ